MSGEAVITEYISKSLEKLNVVIIGDIFLDLFESTSSSRMDSSGNVPVDEVESCLYFLGGAGNVAANVATFAKETRIIGTIGADESSSHVLRLMKEQGINTTGILRTEQTNVKKRILSNGKLHSRLDYCRASKVSNECFISSVREALRDAGVLIIVDHGYGICSHENMRLAVSIANANNVPVIVSARDSDLSNIGHVELLIVNIKEAERMLDFSINLSQNPVTPYSRIKLGDNVCFRQLENIDRYIVTCDSKGFIMAMDDEIIAIPALSARVVNASGAGDVLTALYACFRKSSLPLLLSLMQAGGKLAVENPYTYVINHDVLLSEIFRSQCLIDSSGKILRKNIAARITGCWKDENLSVVFTNGCFDVLHHGHLKLLLAAKKAGDKLVVGINTDESVTALKGSERPVNSLDDRMRLLAELNCVDMVVPFHETTAVSLLEAIQPDVYVKDDAYRDIPLTEKAYARRVLYVPRLPGYSTTDIIHKIRQG